MTWSRLMFQPGMKTHVVPDVLQQVALTELQQRGAVLHKGFDPQLGYDPVEYAPIKPVDAWYLEFGGMAHKDEPNVEVDTIDGLKIEARADHVAMIIETMRKKSDVRFFSNGKPYRKVYAWTSCIVMAPPQFDQLLASLVRIAPEAQELYDNFYNELKKRFPR